mmetsp:Transcript_20186/g.44047  ORF Transcript_20186/g.44047 Transcript_20186/m.44047 type:complete len:290 (+) Transcript_20186:196-1065(+)
MDALPACFDTATKSYTGDGASSTPDSSGRGTRFSGRSFFQSFLGTSSPNCTQKRVVAVSRNMAVPSRPLSFCPASDCRPWTTTRCPERMHAPWGKDGLLERQKGLRSKPSRGKCTAVRSLRRWPSLYSNRLSCRTSTGGRDQNSSLLKQRRCSLQPLQYTESISKSCSISTSHSKHFSKVNSELSAAGAIKSTIPSGGDSHCATRSSHCLSHGSAFSSKPPSANSISSRLSARHSSQVSQCSGPKRWTSCFVTDALRSPEGTSRGAMKSKGKPTSCLMRVGCPGGQRRR